MIDRTLVGEAAAAAAKMDGIYRWQAGIYDFTRKRYLLGRDRLIADLAPPPEATVLEIGCGTGRNLVQAARRHPHARFYGFDISAVMLETARKSIARAGLEERVTLVQADAAGFDAQALFGVPAFDRVYLSYAVSMIPPWRRALAAGFAAVAPGGRMAVVDFGAQEGLPAWFKAALRQWLSAFSVAPRDDIEAELSALGGAHGARLAVERPYRGYAIYAVLSR